MKCPLCHNIENFMTVAGSDQRGGFLCGWCSLIFIDSRCFLSSSAEKERYLEHNHDPNHEGHRTFLKRALQPIAPFLNSKSRCLDFGCGPSPLLPTLLRDEHNVLCDIYDPLFFPDLPTCTFDFIFAIECFEHFFSPAKELQMLHGLLTPSGILIVMTELWTDLDRFKTWYYARDPSHVMFYHRQTFTYIMQMMGFEILPCEDARVIVMRQGINR
jgi:SAM-dependent methyltransferase